MKLFCSLLASTLILIFLQSSVSAAQLHVTGNRFVDSTGATVLLRGWNVSAKIPPYDTKATKQSFQLLHAWGTNVIRLSYIWEAMEPTRGIYQEDYLQKMDQLVQWAAESNIWVIIDIHQDAFSRYSLQGCGEGFPEWAVSGTEDTPDNGIACKGWGRMMYDDYANNGPMQLEWQAFYSNTNGVRDSYFALLSMLAQRYKSQSNVIGIDLLNEPFGDYSQIYGLYEEAAPYVRAEAPDWILFVSPHAMTSGSLKTVGFGTKPNLSNIALSPHYYDPAIMSFDRYQAAGRYMGETDGIFATIAGWLYPDLRTALLNLSGLAVPGGIDVRSPDQAVADLKATADAWNVPLFIGEFGSPEDAVDLEFFLDEFHMAMDKYQVSGTQWMFSSQWTDANKDGWNQEDLSAVDGNGQPRRTARLSPYPERISGTIKTLQSSYQSVNGGHIGLQLQWTNQPGTGDTLVYLPRLNQNLSLADQYDISVAGANWQINEADQLVDIATNTSNDVSVSITYKDALDTNRCRIYFKHNGFSCSDGVAIKFSGTNALGQQRSFTRYADYPWNKTYDFGEWQMNGTVTISATRNGNTTVTHTLQASSAACGSTVIVEGHAWCFGANWDLK